MARHVDTSGPAMPFRRNFRSNKQALDWLLSREEKGLPPAPSTVLLEWIATIPARCIRARAKRALIARFGLPNVPYLNRPGFVGGSNS